MNTDKNNSGLAAWLDCPELLQTAFKTTRVLAILLAVLALATVVLLAIGISVFSSHGMDIPFFHLLDELDDELEALLLLTAGSVVCAFVSRALWRSFSQRK